MLNQLPIIVLNKRRKNPASSTNENIDAPTHKPIHPPTLARKKIRSILDLNKPEQAIVFPPLK